MPWSLEPRHLLHSALICPLSANAWHLKSRHPFVSARRQLISLSNNNMCGALGGSPMECGAGRQPTDSAHHPPPLWNDPPKKSWVWLNCLLAGVRRFPLLLVQMRYGLHSGLWVWRRRTNHRPCCPPVSNPWTSSWTARPDGSARWDYRMAAQHLPRDLVRPSSGLKNSLERWRSIWTVVS